MTNTNNNYISDYVYLAEASYANFTGVVDIVDVESKDDISIQRIMSAGSGKPENFAKLVINNYTVRAHYTDRTDESSFSGTLFQNKRTGDINNFGVK